MTTCVVWLFWHATVVSHVSVKWSEGKDGRGDHTHLSDRKCTAYHLIQNQFLLLLIVCGGTRLCLRPQCQLTFYSCLCLKHYLQIIDYSCSQGWKVDIRSCQCKFPLPEKSTLQWKYLSVGGCYTWVLKKIPMYCFSLQDVWRKFQAPDAVKG